MLTYERYEEIYAKLQLIDLMDFFAEFTNVINFFKVRKVAKDFLFYNYLFISEGDIIN